MFPAYFTLVGSCCAISLSVFGYLHPWKSSSAVEKYQLGFLLPAFAFNLTNLFVFTPMTIDMMKQRHKVERENNIGDEVGWSKNREKAKILRIHLSPEIPLSKEYEGRRLKVDYAKTKKKKTYAPREKPTPFGPSLALAGNLADMRRDHDGSPPENTKRDVEEDRDFRRKSSREKPSDAGKDSGEEKDVSRRRESKKRTKDGKESGSESGLESGSESESDKEEERRRSRKTRGKRKSDRKSRRRRRDYSSSSSDSESESDYSSEYSDSEESESEDDRRRRKRKRREREERERKRRKREKDKKKTKKSDKDGDRKRKEKKKKKKKSEKVKKGAVTESWGKYGIIRETDMWNKRPEFTAWLLEVKEVNLESLPPWEEKKMFKDFMEDHNTGTFTSKKYYDIDGYYRRKLEKEMKKGLKKAGISERTVFNDEEQRRLEMQELRERQKEEEVLALKRSMEGGMAQAMKEQARLKEEMVYLYKIGDMEGAAAIQRRLDPDVPM